MKTEHTPGPWHISSRRINNEPPSIFSEDGRHVATIMGYGSMNEEREANAALITSAPALLSENARLREWLEQLKQTATAVLSYSKESAEPLAAVLAVDAKVREEKLREALTDAEFLMRKAGKIPGPMQDSFNRSANDARAALQGGGL